MARKQGKQGNQGSQALVPGAKFQQGQRTLVVIKADEWVVEYMDVYEDGVGVRRISPRIQWDVDMEGGSPMGVTLVPLNSPSKEASEMSKRLIVPATKGKTAEVIGVSAAKGKVAKAKVATPDPVTEGKAAQVQPKGKSKVATGGPVVVRDTFNLPEGAVQPKGKTKTTKVQATAETAKAKPKADGAKPGSVLIREFFTGKGGTLEECAAYVTKQKVPTTVSRVAVILKESITKFGFKQTVKGEAIKLTASK